MRLALGYTLIELLVVITIIAIVATLGFANYRRLAEDQVTSKAVGEIQTYLRLAQSNATSSTLCSNQGALSWSLKFTSDQKTIELRCDFGGEQDSLQKTYTLDNNAQILSIQGSSCTGSGWPVKFTYAFGTGTLTVSSPGASPACLASDTWTVTVENTKTNATKTLNVSKGGAIDVE